jgi:FlaA1/EpsC-like NDP-sugar epimerase
MPNPLPSPDRTPDPWKDFSPSIHPRSWNSLASHHLSGKRVLITGAGGSIGSALASAVHASHPDSLLLLDNSENALCQVDRTLRDAGSRHHTPLLASVTDPDTLSRAFAQHQPQIVFHAAALKHVPLMEQNPFAAIETNTLGTLSLIHAAIAHRAEQLIHISTDKAVDPHSIMGASKRIAELILLTTPTSATHITALRLCNVIGSEGSVLPLFLEQLAHNLPLTVTHADAHRYFITLDRTIEALFTALQPHPTSAILIPEIVAPIRILDLAHHLLRTHQSSLPVEFTGLRPGDKLSELLLSPRERLHRNTTSPLHLIETLTPSSAILHAELNALRHAIQTHDLQELLRATLTLVPEYQPSHIITSALAESQALEIPA